MLKPLLIEIGVEELPAIPLLKELKNIEKKWLKILQENSLACEFEFYYTPRRLTLLHSEFKLKQEDSVEEMFGAPKAIAFKDGEPTNAALGFAKKCGVSLDQIGFAQKGNKEVLYYKKEIVGKDSSELLDSMINKFMNSLEFGKSMRWGSNSKSFIRPIRWLNVMLDSKKVDCELYGVSSDTTTFVHRVKSFDAVEVTDIKKYFEILESSGVTLYQDKRREDILKDFKSIESKNSIEIDLDEELLDEVVAITENPKALLGSFDEKYLRLPSEVIVTSMKEHQRYFPVFKDGKITNSFVVVSNALCDDYSKVIEGNEKVLRPRLDDSLFFYDNDLKNGLSKDGLENVTFMDGLGSLTDKIQREKKIANILFEMYKSKLSQSPAQLERAMDLAKTDLMSEMVYEFTELQGLMGYYYSVEAGEDECVSLAIKEQYLPQGEDSDIPSSVFSAIVALSIKLDTLIGLFSVNQIPTGSRDPFALRRAVNGIFKILKEYELEFDIKKMVAKLSKEYNSFDQDKLIEFIFDRLNKAYSVNPSVIKAVLSSGESEVNKIDKKIIALDNIVNAEGFKDRFSTFKRVSNISKDLDMNEHLIADETLFSTDNEKSLYKAYNEVISKKYIDYEDELDALFSLKNELDSFFENVMVNDKDEKIKINRLSLVGLIYQSIFKIADIKEISV